jgi:uncharacterized protein (TIGR03437 family)
MAQAPEVERLNTVRPMMLDQTEYRLRAGESADIAAPQLKLITAVTTVPEVRYPIRASVQPDGKSIRLTVPPTTPRGAYTVTLFALDSSEAARTGSVHMTVEPMQLAPSAPPGTVPVILLNGWQALCTTSDSTIPASVGTFGQLAYQLQSEELSVAFFNNCSYPDIPIESLGVELAAFMSDLNYADGTPVSQFDLVAHSMGGLIARAYLSGLQDDESLQPPANPRIRKLILIATPNFGSFYASNYSYIADAGKQSSEMIAGSPFLWNLGTWNQWGDDLRGVDALSLVGNGGAWTNRWLLPTITLPNASDGVVSLTSGSLGFAYTDSSRTRVLPYCHTDQIPLSCSGSPNQNYPQPSIANVDEAPETGQIILSFLSNTSDWMSIGGTPTTDPYLSRSGGMFFAWANAADQYVTDLTQVDWGSVALQPGGATDTVFYDEFVSGTGAFQLTSQSLGTVSCGSFTEPLGYYSVARCKSPPLISSVRPLLPGVPGWVVNSGSTVTVSGSGFGQQQCSACTLFAVSVGSSTEYRVPISMWSDQTISAPLPAILSGLVRIIVQTASGSDAINIMAAQAPAIAASPSSLQFSYTIGGTVPPAQSIQVTNSGGGTLTWSATATAAWLALSASAPSNLAVSLSPAGLAAGTYTSSVQISAAGASNSPVSIAVTLTVAAAPPSLVVAPRSLTFNYTVGGAAPAAQGISITNAGGGTPAWSASASAAWVALSSASGTAPATLSVSVNPATLAPGTYTASVQITASGATGSPASVGVTLTVQAPQPTVNITAVANGASFQPSFASATWVSIFGTNLSESARGWQAGDFVNGLLPTSLDGVSVTFDGLPAYVEYISPTQINVLAPDDAKVGPVQVQVTTAQGTSNSFPAQKQQFGPAFFTIGGYVAALHADYTIVGKAGLIAGVTTRPAKPGEVILLFATGFGPTNPRLPSAQLVTAPAVLANSVQITIGGVVVAPPAYAGLVGAGLYQFNVTVPSVANGDAAVVAQIGGVQTQTGALITIQE